MAKREERGKGEKPPEPDNSVEISFSIELSRGEPVALESAVSGRIVETGKGNLYLVESDAGSLLESGDQFLADAPLFFGRSQVDLDLMRKVDEELANLAVLDQDHLLFLDIETCGFHGTPLFLVGLLSYRGGRFEVSQLFARNLSEEAAVLEHLSEFYRSREALVTFNGRSFDLPFIDERALVHGVRLRRPGVDYDLLSVARRMWGDRLPNCKLGTLEECVCGRCRSGDLPSSEIPETYRQFVETGDAAAMVDVFRHNAYDLLAMAHMLARLAGGRVELVSEPGANRTGRSHARRPNKARQTRAANSAAAGGMLTGKAFVFTGKLESMERTEAEEIVRSLGGMASSSVSARTDFVVAGPRAGSKLDAARELGVGIIDERAFLRMIGRK